MKKIVSALLILYGCGTLHALPVGNPSDASLLTRGVIREGHDCDPCLSWCETMSIRIGFYGDYVYNRHMKVHEATKDAIIEHTALNTNAAYLALNFYDFIDIFGTLGGSNIIINTNANAFSSFQAYFTLASTTSFSWSIGTRATLWESGCSSLGAEFQYFAIHPEISKITSTGDDINYVDNTLDSTYREWQIGIGFSQRIHMLVPYIAIKWSGAQMLFNHARFISTGLVPIELFNLKTQGCVGWALGVSLIGCEMASISVEGRFSDEKALYVNGQVRF